MTDTQLDILEIKQTLKDMKKSIDRIKAILKDDYYNEKIIEFYMNEEDDKNYVRRQQIDELMNYYIEMKLEYRNSKEIVDMCNTALNKLHKEYIDLTLEDEE